MDKVRKRDRGVIEMHPLSVWSRVCAAAADRIRERLRRARCDIRRRKSPRARNVICLSAQSKWKVVDIKKEGKGF